MFGSNEKLKWNQTKEGLIISLPEKLPEQPVIGFKISGK